MQHIPHVFCYTQISFTHLFIVLVVTTELLILRLYHGPCHYGAKKWDSACLPFIDFNPLQ